MPTSTRDVAAAGASCVDGSCEEDVLNGDAGERAGHGSGGRAVPGTAAATHTSADVEAATANLKLAAPGPGGEDGRAAPRDVAVAGAGSASAAAGTGALPAGQFCMPAVKWQIEIRT